jgi:hypothetical protein
MRAWLDMSAHVRDIGEGRVTLLELRRDQSKHGKGMRRWMKWMAAVLDILMKVSPAKTAASGQIFPSEAHGHFNRTCRHRLRNCLRYVDCTVDRRRMRRRA